MPPSTLQARIKAFEALGSGASKEVLDGVAIHAEPEHLLDRPHSPSAASIPPIVPTTYSPSASPNSLRNRNSLLDLKDWVIDDGPLGTSHNTACYSPLQVNTPLPHESAPLISFDGSPQKFVGAPPLPPRKLSFNSPRSVSAPAASPTITTTSPSNNMLMPPATDAITLNDLSPSDSIRRRHMHASSVSSLHSVSLSSEGDDLATPGALHAFPMEREWTGTGTEDGESLDESFENVSAPSSFLPPSSLPPRQPSLSPAKPVLVLPTKQPPPPPPPPSFQPPKLPQRPVPYTRGSTHSSATHSSSPSPVNSGIGSPVTRTSSASSSSLSLQNTRRVPPPPPPVAAAILPTNASRPPRSHPPSARTSVLSTTTTASDRSSIFSQGTTTSRTSVSSRTSVLTPTSAPGAKQQAQATRARYDALFSANVRAHAHKPRSPPTPTPAKRQNAGWRGLSIDVPPTPAPPPGPAPITEPGPEAKLDGRLVREIWLKSRLGPQRLRGIWNECDPDGTGSLDRDAFARGMARIDEDLRRAQVLGRARAGSSASAPAPRPVPSRPILR